MKISVYDLAHSKGMPAAATEAMLLMQDRIEAQEAEIARLREALKVYAGPMEWQNLEGGPDSWGKFPVWADGYPGGVFIDDNTLDFGETAREALGERE